MAARLADGSLLVIHAMDLRTKYRGRYEEAKRDTKSPQVSFRIPKALRDEAARRAAAEGKSVSQLAREALERYLAS